MTDKYGYPVEEGSLVEVKRHGQPVETRISRIPERESYISANGGDIAMVMVEGEEIAYESNEICALLEEWER